jgi:MFS superfamily sulfate permease-like transporter
LNEIAAKIDDLTVADARDRIPRMVATELEPRLVAYRAEMASVRDSLFGDLMKAVTDWKVPALSFGSMATMGYTAAITAFVSSAAAMATKPVVDYVTARRGAARKHAVSYLVGLKDS